MNDWSNDIEVVLEKIRKNCAILSDEHKHTYFRLKNTLSYFRLPLIVISGLNSVFSVGSQSYVKQETISGITCLLSLICSIIGSIELFLSIQKRVENELISSRDYYLLSIDIQKTLLLDRDHRPLPAKEYLEKIYNNYIKLTEQSNLVKRALKDELAIIPAPSTTPTPSQTPPRTPSVGRDEEWGLSIVIP